MMNLFRKLKNKIRTNKENKRIENELKVLKSQLPDPDELNKAISELLEILKKESYEDAGKSLFH